MAATPSRIKIIPLERMSIQERDEFENPGGPNGWPKIGSKLMQRIVTGECGPGGWITLQDEIYRSSVGASFTVRIVFREYLAAEVSWNECLNT